MSKHSYTEIEFKNAPDHKTTPLNATNLNHIEGGISDAFTDIRAVENALAPINLDNGTNNTGSTIKAGTYFYVSGAICKAKTDIANGATLTENTNYKVVTAGSLNDLLDSSFYSMDFSNRSWQGLIYDFWTSYVDRTKLTAKSILVVDKGGLDISVCHLVSPNLANNTAYALFLNNRHGYNEEYYFDYTRSLCSYKDINYNGNVKEDHSSEQTSVTLTMYY